MYIFELRERLTVCRSDRDKKTFFAKWVRFETYRKVVIGN